jgi:hypothetical protein
MAKQRAKKEGVPAKRQQGVSDPQVLLQELWDLIQSARSGVAQAVNSALLLLYWQVGQRITVEPCAIPTTLPPRLWSGMSWPRSLNRDG